LIEKKDEWRKFIVQRNRIQEVAHHLASVSKAEINYENIDLFSEFFKDVEKISLESETPPILSFMGRAAREYCDWVKAQGEDVFLRDGGSVLRDAFQAIHRVLFLLATGVKTPEEEIDLSPVMKRLGEATSKASIWDQLESLTSESVNLSKSSTVAKTAFAIQVALSQKGSALPEAQAEIDKLMQNLQECSGMSFHRLCHDELRLGRKSFCLTTPKVWIEEEVVSEVKKEIQSWQKRLERPEAQVLFPVSLSLNHFGALYCLEVKLSRTGEKHIKWFESKLKVLRGIEIRVHGQSFVFPAGQQPAAGFQTDSMSSPRWYLVEGVSDAQRNKTPYRGKIQTNEQVDAREGSRWVIDGSAFFKDQARSLDQRSSKMMIAFLNGKEFAIPLQQIVKIGTVDSYSTLIGKVKAGEQSFQLKNLKTSLGESGAIGLFFVAIHCSEGAFAWCVDRVQSTGTLTIQKFSWRNDGVMMGSMILDTGKSIPILDLERLSEAEFRSERGPSSDPHLQSAA
jgi:hypothetical protein